MLYTCRICTGAYIRVLIRFNYANRAHRSLCVASASILLLSSLSLLLPLLLLFLKYIIIVTILITTLGSSQNRPRPLPCCALKIFLFCNRCTLRAIIEICKFDRLNDGARTKTTILRARFSRLSLSVPLTLSLPFFFFRTVSVLIVRTHTNDYHLSV